jgi:AhpC/TSA family
VVKISEKTKKRVISALCAIAVLWVIGCAFIYRQMRKPPEQFGHFMTKIPAPVAFLAFPFESMWMRARAGELNVGDAAPDFSLQRLHEDGRVQLSDLNRQQPVVLIFGSYT